MCAVGEHSSKTHKVELSLFGHALKRRHLEGRGVPVFAWCAQLKRPIGVRQPVAVGAWQPFTCVLHLTCGSSLLHAQSWSRS